MTTHSNPNPPSRRPALPADVEAAITNYCGTSGLADRDPVRFAEVQNLVRSCQPTDVNRAESLMTVACWFTTDTPPPDGVPLVSWLDRPRGERWLHSRRYQHHTFKTKRGYVRQLADVAAGITLRPKRAAKGPNLPTIDPATMSRLLDATRTDPGARWSLIAAGGAGILPTEPVTFESAGGRLFVCTPGGVVHVVTGPVPDDVALVPEVGPGDWRRLGRISRDNGVSTRFLGSCLTRTWRRSVFNTYRPFAEYMRTYELSERAVEGVLQQLDDVDWSVASRLLRGDGEIVEGGSDRASAPVPSPIGNRPGGSVPKKMSRAAAQRAAAFARKQFENPELPDQLERRLQAYQPRDVDPAVWALVRDDHHLIIRRSNTRGVTAFDHNCSTLARYLAHRAGKGLATDPSESMTDTAINAYVVTGLFDVNEGTAATYTSRLRRLAKHANPSLDAVPQPSHFTYSNVQPPYTPAEEAALRRVALRQRRPKARRQLCAIVGFGGGAGLNPTGMRHLRENHVIDHGDGGIEVNVPDGRRIMVRREYEAVVRAALEGLAPGALLLGTKPTRRNVTSSAIANAEIYDDVPAVDMDRLRTTWLVWLIGRPVPLKVVLDAAGLTSARTLISLIPFVADTPTDADLLRGEER